MRVLEANELKCVSGGLQAIIVTANIYSSFPNYFWDYPSSGDVRGPVFYGGGGGGGGGSVSRPPISASNPAGVSGLGPELDSAIALSSIMGNELKDVLSWGYHMEWSPTTGEHANQTYTDYTNQTIYVAQGMSQQNTLGALAHEFGHAMYGHYYGVTNAATSTKDVFVNDWMQNEGYSQVNVMRIGQQFAPLGDYIHLAGSSNAQIQSEYQAFSAAQGRLANDPTLVSERGVDPMRLSGSMVGSTMRVEDAGGGMTYEQKYSSDWQNWHNQHP